MAHNLLNPQTVRDIEREKKLSTEFAKSSFWGLRDKIGHKHWVVLRRHLDRNVNAGKPSEGVIRLIAQIRKNERQREWSTRDKRLRELKNFAGIYAREDFQETSGMSESDLFQVGDNVTHVQFGKDLSPS